MIRHASDPAPWVKKPSVQTGRGAGYDTSAVATTAPRGLSLDGVAAADFLAPADAARKVERDADIPIRDWEVLFCAVKDRLSLSVGEGQDPDSMRDRRSGSGVMRASLIECVQALNHLHGMLAHEVVRCEQLERSLFDAQTELAQSRADLLCTQERAQRDRTGRAFFDLSLDV